MSSNLLLSSSPVPKFGTWQYAPEGVRYLLAAGRLPLAVSSSSARSMTSPHGPTLTVWLV